MVAQRPCKLSTTADPGPKRRRSLCLVEQMRDVFTRVAFINLLVRVLVLKWESGDIAQLATH